MEFPRLMQRMITLASSDWRWVALLVGLSLSPWGCKDVQEYPFCVSPTSLVVAVTGSYSMVQQTTLGPATIDAADDAQPVGESDSDRRIKNRLLTVALVGGVLLLLLAFAYGYLRLELTTRGFYSGRLQIASGIASLSVITAAYFLWRWIVS